MVCAYEDSILAGGRATTASGSRRRARGGVLGGKIDKIIEGQSSVKGSATRECPLARPAHWPHYTRREPAGDDVRSNNDKPIGAQVNVDANDIWATQCGYGLVGYCKRSGGEGTRTQVEDWVCFVWHESHPVMC